ncbi:MAG: type II toxin-antitoxin system HicA family toxin [Candidatus Kapabacteria bacterium]|jgi:predicted RNA binding protein YcfA (HicA-like mRNA interferase family)|nr:type II toxin-antitoxin system HicA family toxin [Candidatus Kapabacteria bacterium]
MSDKTPRITAKQIIQVLEKLGFTFKRQSGSHKIYRHADGRRVVVPMHSSVILHPKTLQSIQRDANLSTEQLKSLL